MKSNKVVSVLMITYKHEPFIAQAIEGVLMQETNFDFELLIADDCSPDKTEEIVNDLITNHPKGKLIKYFRHPQNIGMQSNSDFVIRQCSGKYISICEGDDYWTDPKKLQKQYDFLERNPDYFLCAHRIVEKKCDQFFQIANDKTDYTFSDFAISGSCNGIYTCSIFFRNSPKILDIFLEDWVLQLDGGDHLVLLLSTLNGHKVKLFNNVMGVYRIHEGGVWSSSSIEKKVKDAIITNRLYIENLNLSKIQKNQVHYGLTLRIRQFYYTQFKNRYIRKIVSVTLKLIFIAGPGGISNFLIDFYSKRILNRF